MKKKTNHLFHALIFAAIFFSLTVSLSCQVFGTQNPVTYEIDISGKTVSEYGYIDFGVSVPQRENSLFQRYKALNLPRRYSSVDAGLITSVKSQSPYGTCWAFSAISAAETEFIKRNEAPLSETNFSEFQHIYFAYHKSADPLGLTSSDQANDEPDYLDAGGNGYTSTFTMAKWAGLSDENDSLLTYYGELSSRALSNQYAYLYDSVHLENAYWISIKDTADIKNMLINLGAATISYYHDDLFFNEETNAYYNNENEYSNHSVTLVGWDDDYPKENFSITPQNNGAWLIKNSWGKYWGDNGYFWLSYEDTSIANQTIFFYMKNMISTISMTGIHWLIHIPLIKNRTATFQIYIHPSRMKC